MRERSHVFPLRTRRGEPDLAAAHELDPSGGARVDAVGRRRRHWRRARFLRRPRLCHQDVRRRVVRNSRCFDAATWYVKSR